MRAGWLALASWYAGKKQEKAKQKKEETPADFKANIVNQSG